MTAEEKEKNQPTAKKMYQIIHECGCGNTVKENLIDPAAKSFELKDRVCNVCPGARNQMYPMLKRLGVVSVESEPKKSK